MLFYLRLIDFLFFVQIFKEALKRVLVFSKNCLGKKKKIPQDFSGFIANVINAEKNLEPLSENTMTSLPLTKMMDLPTY